MTWSISSSEVSGLSEGAGVGGADGAAPQGAGAAQGSATAIFEPEKAHGAWALLRDQDMETDTLVAASAGV